MRRGMKLGRILTALNTKALINIGKSALGRVYDYNIGRATLGWTFDVNIRRALLGLNFC
jgi:hypothetical protein